MVVDTGQKLLQTGNRTLRGKAQDADIPDLRRRQMLDLAQGTDRCSGSRRDPFDRLAQLFGGSLLFSRRRSGAEVLPQSSSTGIPKGESSCRKVCSCCRARSSVGAISAPCIPFLAASHRQAATPVMLTAPDSRRSRHTKRTAKTSAVPKAYHKKIWRSAPCFRACPAGGGAARPIHRL